VGIAGVGAFVAAPPAAAANQLHGIDVSNWQGGVDWGAVRRSGRVFAFAKATEGVSFVDRTLAANRQGMAQAGLLLHGFYHFARPDRNSAAAEANHFLQTIGGRLGPGEVAVLDLEVAAGPGVGNWAAEWLARVAQATGRTPILYSYQSYLNNIPTAGLTRYPLWVAAWGRNDGNVPATAPRTAWARWTWWQFTSNAFVPGVSGRTDESLFVGSADELAAFGRPAGAAAQPNPLADLLRKLLPGLPHH
jgi:lysozyme